MNKLTLYILIVCLIAACSPKSSDFPFDVPAEHLEEREEIPSFWLATTAEIEDYLKTKVHKGSAELLGKSAGGRPIYAVTYGTQRQGTGTATYSGASSVNKISAFRGEESDKKVYMVLSGVQSGRMTILSRESANAANSGHEAPLRSFPVSKTEIRFMEPTIPSSSKPAKVKASQTSFKDRPCKSTYSFNNLYETIILLTYLSLLN